MEGIFDSHAHWFDPRFDAEYPGGADALLPTVYPNPVSMILNVATNPDNARKAIAQAAKYEGMYVAVGIHPEDCHSNEPKEKMLADLRAVLGDERTRKRDKIVAVGEIGLDYHAPDFSGIALDKEREAYFFEEQLKIAGELGLPVVIHDRDAHGDCFETVLKYPDVRGVFHCYSGSVEMARELLRRGFYLSFGGSLTFKNAKKVREVAEAVPRDRVLIETDCPYLAPHPFRGSLNHSGMLPVTLSALAGLWNVSPDEAAKITAENAKRLFCL